jgi:hypothetical protein
MNTEWLIEIQDRPAMLLTDIWIYRRGFNGKVIVLYSLGEDKIEEKEYDTGFSRLPATLTISTYLVPVLLAAIVSKGIKPPEQSFVQGKLEATELHLQDLRHLLKIPLEHTINIEKKS